MSAKTCVACSKDIEQKKPECEEEGVAYHFLCFRCCICKCELNERTVKIRENKLYCEYHARPKGYLQPFCKIYYFPFNKCYRIILATDKAPDDEEEGAENKDKKTRKGANEDEEPGEEPGRREEAPNII